MESRTPPMDAVGGLKASSRGAERKEGEGSREQSKKSRWRLCQLNLKHSERAPLPVAGSCSRLGKQDAPDSQHSPASFLPLLSGADGSCSTNPVKEQHEGGSLEPVFRSREEGVLQSWRGPWARPGLALSARVKTGERGLLGSA